MDVKQGWIIRVLLYYCRCYNDQNKTFWIMWVLIAWLYGSGVDGRIFLGTEDRSQSIRWRKTVEPRRRGRCPPALRGRFGSVHRTRFAIFSWNKHHMYGCNLSNWQQQQNRETQNSFCGWAQKVNVCQMANTARIVVLWPEFSFYQSFAFRDNIKHLCMNFYSHHLFFILFSLSSIHATLQCQ